MNLKHLGIIFDWDGVVLDSSSFHEESWNILAARRSLSLPEGHFHRGFGMRNETIIPEVLEWTQVPEEISELAQEKELIYRELLKQKGIEPLPGVQALLSELKSLSIRTAVGSSTPRENLDLAMSLLQLEDFFEVTVCGNDVKRGKPFPDVFQTAADRLGCEYHHCVVIEDAPVGIEAAHRAGMQCVAIPTTNSIQVIQNADLIIPSLEDIVADQLAQLILNPGHKAGLK